MRPRVLMARRTGEMFVSYRVTLLDQDWHLDITDSRDNFRIVSAQCDGWIIEMPKDVSMFPLYFNNAGVAKMFEDLGWL